MVTFIIIWLIFIMFPINSSYIISIFVTSIAIIRVFLWSIIFLRLVFFLLILKIMGYTINDIATIPTRYHACQVFVVDSWKNMNITGTGTGSNTKTKGIIIKKKIVAFRLPNNFAGISFLHQVHKWKEFFLWHSSHKLIEQFGQVTGS